MQQRHRFPIEPLVPTALGALDGPEQSWHAAPHASAPERCLEHLVLQGQLSAKALQFGETRRFRPRWCRLLGQKGRFSAFLVFLAPPRKHTFGEPLLAARLSWPKLTHADSADHIQVKFPAMLSFLHHFFSFACLLVYNISAKLTSMAVR